MQVEEGNHYLMTKEELENKIATLTGGRAAEEVRFGVISILLFLAPLHLHLTKIQIHKKFLYIPPEHSKNLHLLLSLIHI